MINTLIVNNDQKILNKVKKIVKWERLGFNITIVKDSYEIDMDNILNSKLDLIISDIKMPHLCGFELYHKAKKLNPNVILVVLTSRDEFKYAQKALQISACDYILTKDLTVSKITDTLVKVKKIIKKNKKESETLLKYYREVQDNKFFFREKIVSDIINGYEANKKFINEKKKVYKLIIPDEKVRLTIFFIDDFYRQMEKSYLSDASIAKFAIINILEELFDVTVFFYNNCFIVPVDGEKYDKNCTNMKAGLTRNTILRLLNINLSVCIDEEKSDLLHIKESYYRLVELRENYFYLCQGQICNVDDNVNFLSMGNNYYNYLETFKIRVEKHHSFLRTFENCLGEIKEKQYEPSSVKKLMKELQKLIEKRIESIGLNYVKKRYYYDNYDMCRENIIEIFNYYYKYFEILDKVGTNSDVLEVIKYINENLENDISLDSAAQLVFKNPSHLSRLFKKHTGKTFTQYLIDGRIKRATYLLKETTLSISYICSQIGLENPRYFYKFYKRETGKSPSEVRRYT